MRIVKDGSFTATAFRHASSATGAIEPVTVTKPWGEEIWYVYTDQYALKRLKLNHGARFSLQLHQEKAETWLVEEGVVTLEVGRDRDHLETIQLHPGDLWHNAPQTVHRAAALYGPVIILEVSTPELTDVVHLADDYGRQ